MGSGISFGEVKYWASEVIFSYCRFCVIEEQYLSFGVCCKLEA